LVDKIFVLFEFNLSQNSCVKLDKKSFQKITRNEVYTKYLTIPTWHINLTLQLLSFFVLSPPHISIS